MRALATLILAAVAGLMLAQAARADTVLSMNNWPSPRHNLNAEVLVPWSRLVTEATEGRVTFRIPAGGLAEGKNVYDAVAGGVVDVAFAIHGYTPARFPFSLIVEFPLSGDSAAVLSVAYWRTYQKYFASSGLHKGVELLGLFTHGPGQIFTRDFPITSLADLKNVKMRTGGGLQRDIAKRIGTVIVAAEMPRAYEILSRGTADGIFLPFESMTKYRLEGFLKYQADTPGGLYNTSFMVIMNGDKWDALADRDKRAIRSVSGERLALMAGESWDRREVAERKKLKGRINVVPASAAFLEDLRALSMGLQEDWLLEMDRRHGMDGRPALAMLRRQVDKLTREMNPPSLRGLGAEPAT